VKIEQLANFLARKGHTLSRPWTPPSSWRASDGCSGVLDFHWREACRKHDWRWRRLGASSVAMALVVIMLSNVAFLLDMEHENLERGKKAPWWYIVPFAYFTAVTFTGPFYFNTLGREA